MNENIEKAFAVKELWQVQQKANNGRLSLFLYSLFYHKTTKIEMENVK